MGYLERPSLKMYNRALYNSLERARLSPGDALQAVKAAKRQQLNVGLRGSDDVPTIPRRMNQAQSGE